jgi:16S rRNA (adenine1518-N6/adenine1519-N6)-dimethyltransferase
VTLSRPEVQRLLADHGLRPSRALGQNFVVDPNTVRRIVRLAGVTDGAAVVEVGAGLGSLTLALAEAGAQVVAVEVDRGLVPILRQVVAGRSVTVVEADALQVDWDELLGSTGTAALPDAAGGVGPRDLAGEAGLPGPAGAAGQWSLVSNLPYNVATPLVVQVLEQAPQVGSLLVMVQREVGERLAARPGQAAYGAVSVVVDYWAEASVVGRVPPTVFVPRPNVESALVRIDRRPSPAVPVAAVTYDRLRQVVRAGFAQRRKMLRRSLAGVVPAAAFAATDIAPEARAEELDVVQWGRLAGWTEAT